MATVNSDSDDDLIVEDVESTRQAVSLQTRLDEYLNASKLGRLAYQAGDVRLATDRFNLALDIELQVELESFNDFGVTGQILRQELQKKALDPLDQPPYNSILNKLKALYENADIASALDPSEPKWYIQMGAALCILNEWEKAKRIYREGLSRCSENLPIQKELNRLNKIEEMMNLLGDRVDSSKGIDHGSPKPRRRRQSSIDGMNLTDVPRSRSFTLDKRVKKVSSPKSFDHIESGTLSFSMPHKKRSSLFQIFKKPRSPLSNELPMSWSSEDLLCEDKLKNRERTDWKYLFTSAACVSQLHHSNLGSRTIESMRSINALTL